MILYVISNVTMVRKVKPPITEPSTTDLIENDQSEQVLNVLVLMAGVMYLVGAGVPGVRRSCHMDRVDGK